MAFQIQEGAVAGVVAGTKRTEAVGIDAAEVGRCMDVVVARIVPARSKVDSDSLMPAPQMMLYQLKPKYLTLHLAAAGVPAVAANRHTAPDAVVVEEVEEAAASVPWVHCCKAVVGETLGYLDCTLGADVVAVAVPSFAVVAAVEDIRSLAAFDQRRGVAAVAYQDPC